MKKFFYKSYKLIKDLQILFLIRKRKINIYKKKILIVKPDAIGDYILFRNFISKIKDSKKYRNHEIYFLGNTLWRDIFENFDKKVVKKSFWINSKEIYYSKINKLEDLIKLLDKENFETIIYPMFSRISGMDILISKINAKEKIGFLGDTTNSLKLEKPFLDKVYTRLIKTKENFEFDKNKNFFEQILKEKINAKNPKLEMKNKEKNYIVVNPGASDSLRRWSPRNFAKIIDYIIKKYGSEIYIVGSKSELSLNNKVKNLSNYKKEIKIFNNRSLTDLIEIISKSKGIISNETSTTHIAVALGKKVYCISNGNHYGRFHPYSNYKDAQYFYPEGFNPKKDLTKDKLSFLNIDEVKVDKVKERLMF